MPELPEVERLRQSLLPHLLGRVIVRARVLRGDVVTHHRADGGVWRAARGARGRLLQGATVGALTRRGKQLAIVGQDGRTLVVHLGMSGQLLFRTGKVAALTHVHARWECANAGGGVMGELVFRDPRRFGGLWTFPSVESLCAHRWSELGPDALAIEAGELQAVLKDSKRTIKAGLLDQRVLAGVGNIYADEALFAAGVSPRCRCDRVPGEAWARLADAVRDVLKSAVRHGGSTLRDYVDANGAAGFSQTTHAAYGRGGQPCLRCGKTLKHSTIAQRTTVWCAHCQGARPTEPGLIHTVPRYSGRLKVEWGNRHPVGTPAL